MGDLVTFCTVLSIAVFVSVQHVDSSDSPSQSSPAPNIPRAPPTFKEVCFPHVGCYNNAPPFDNANLRLPKSPTYIRTKFLIFTRANHNETMFVDYVNKSSLENTNFNASLPTKFIIHGFTNTIKTEWMYIMKDELLKKEDMNVVIVAWGPGAALPDYNGAVANLRVVATQTMMLMKNMAALGAGYDKMHIIGHSLGAHTGGYVGKMLKKENIVFDRITGLDPAEPDFKDHPKAVRLSKLDARYVDVIHTNGAPFSSGGAGMFDPCGHIDFYVNGGETQPDCPNQISGILSCLFGCKTDISTVASCSHSRAHDVFTESINTDCPFTAYPCTGYDKFQNGDCFNCGTTGCGTLGYYSNFLSKSTGMMFLNTQWAKPFCGFHFLIKVNAASNTDNSKGKIQVQINGTWGTSEWLDVTRSEEDDLARGKQLNRVVVEHEIIGSIESINVKYTKAKGNMFGFGTGRTNVDLQQIQVYHGENDDKYLFCIDKPMHSGTTYTYNTTEKSDCTKPLTNK